MGLTSDLCHRLTVYNRKAVELDTGEIAFEHLPDKKIWGALSVVSGKVETLPGDMERQNITHRLFIRSGACKLATDTYFEYKGQKYEVLYWQPHYKHRDRLEILLKMVVE